jgi:hypothetical protein
VSDLDPRLSKAVTAHSLIVAALSFIPLAADPGLAPHSALRRIGERHTNPR